MSSRAFHVKPSGPALVGQLFEGIGNVEEATGRAPRKVRVGQIGPEGMVAAYSDKDGPVLLIHRADWPALLVELTTYHGMQLGAVPDQVLGIPVEIDGEANRPRPSYTPPPPLPPPLMIRCVDLAGAPGVPGCCSSCHTDEDEYGIPLGGAEAPPGVELAVCCAVASWISSQGGQRALQAAIQRRGGPAPRKGQ